MMRVDDMQAIGEAIRNAGVALPPDHHISAAMIQRKMQIENTQKSTRRIAWGLILVGVTVITVWTALTAFLIGAAF